MRKMTALAASLAFLLAALSCVSQSSGRALRKNAPAWIGNPYALHAKDDFLCAVGEARSRQAAEYDAAQEIASAFSQDIDAAASYERALSLQSDSSGGAARQDAQSVRQTVLRTVSVDDIVSMEIAETWFDEGGETWYALAALDRQNAWAIYAERLRQNEARVQNLLSAGDGEGSLAYFFALKEAETLAQKNDALADMCLVLNPRDKLYGAYTSERSVASLASSFAERHPIYVDGGDFAAAFSELLKSKGFGVTNDAAARIKLVAESAFSYSVPPDAAMHFCECALECRLYDGGLQTVFAPWSAAVRVGGVTEEAAKTRAIRTMEIKIKNEYMAEWD